MRKCGSVVLAILLVFSPIKIFAAETLPANFSTSEIKTHFYKLNAKTFDLGSPWVAKYDNNKIVTMSADDQGPLRVISILDTRTLVSRSLASIKFPDSEGRAWRVLDLKVNTFNLKKTHLEILVSFATAESNLKCRRINVYSFSVPLSPIEVRTIQGNKFFQSTCFEKPAESGDSGYSLGMSGGRIEFIPKSQWVKKTEQELLLTTGDFAGFLENNKSPTKVQLQQISSILRVTSKSWRTVASGFRNPQGLAWVQVGGKTLLLESEHGPRGGDEINIVNSNNYGWPTYSYGTSYEENTKDYKFKNAGTSGTSALPLFSWVPSIAPSQLLQSTGLMFSKYWTNSKNLGQEGDILVSSLGGNSIFRLRLEKGSVKYVEPIYVGQRIRTMVQMSDGSLALGTDSGSVLLIRASHIWSELNSGYVPIP